MEARHQLETLTGYHLRRASSLMMADLAERLSELGLRTTEASILVVLHDDPLITQSEIGRRLAIKRANMAPLIAGLVARGLISRAQPVGRSHPLKLSRKGVSLAARARTRMEEHDTDFFGALGVAERRDLQAILTTLWQNRAT